MYDYIVMDETGGNLTQHSMLPLEANIVEFRFDDVDDELVRGINPQHVPRNSVVFYCKRRHFLEVIPELVLSISIFLICVALIVYLQPWACGGCDLWIVYTPFIFLLATIISFLPFILEVVRWRHDIMILTQFDLKKIAFDFRGITQKTTSYGFIADADIDVPLAYRWMGFDTGSLVVTSTKQSKRTPLVPNPATLLSRIRMAEMYKEPVSDTKEWRMS